MTLRRNGVVVPFTTSTIKGVSYATFPAQAGSWTANYGSTRANQTITFGALANKTIGQPPFTVAATASSGLTVTFSSATPAVCTAGGTNGTTITLVATGLCTVRADQAGDAAFNAAPTVSQSFTISPPSPTVDATTSRDGVGPVTTPAFSTVAPGELIVAFVSTGGPPGSVQTATVSGAGLTWTLGRRANARLGTSELWVATASAALTNVTVSASTSAGGFDISLTVVTFRGATGVGASAGASAARGAPRVALTATRANSLVFGVANDWDRAIARTVPADQVMVHQFLDTAARDTYWAQRLSGPTPSAGQVVTLNDTAPTNDQWNFAAVEIIP
jgi:hypothetical protein